MATVVPVRFTTTMFLDGRCVTHGLVDDGLQLEHLAVHPRAVGGDHEP